MTFCEVIDSWPDLVVIFGYGLIFMCFGYMLALLTWSDKPVGRE